MNNLIIHPTDFSESSVVAFEYATHLAEIFQCELLLVHSIDSSQLEGFDESGYSLLTRSEEIEKEAEKKMQELGNAAIEKGLKCRAQLYSGSLTSWLPDIIKKERPLFTVMGTTGAGSVANKIFGSNTNSIIQTSSSPVLAIPLQTKFVTPKKVVLAADLEKVDKEKAAFLYKMVGAISCSLQLVYVVKEGDAEKGRAVMDEVDEMFKAFEKPINTAFTLIENNDYIHGVRDYVEREKPDIFSIIMTDKNFIEKFLFGSLSEKMIHGSNVPLLVLPK